MAKWDIKDGFWRLDCARGEEWNFAYVLPSSVGGEIILVVPTSLQMGWIESPPYFCAASETARDVAAQYAELPLGTLSPHALLPQTTTHPDYLTLPTSENHLTTQTPMKYLMEVFVDDFIALVIPASRRHLDHIGTSMMKGIHDVFPSSSTDEPISEKKLEKGDGAWTNVKEILGMVFDGTSKTIWLTPEKRDNILVTLKTWLRIAQ